LGNKEDLRTFGVDLLETRHSESFLLGLNSFFITVFSLIDDLLENRRMRQRGPALSSPTLSVLTIKTVGEFLGLDTDTGIYYFRRHYPHFFASFSGDPQGAFAR
jgi:hypothetical protein